MRDVLHVDDLVRAYSGNPFRQGGGPGLQRGRGPIQVLSLLDLVETLQHRLGNSLPVQWDDWRPGDQRIYISDIRKLHQVLDWKPEIGVSAGIWRLISWVEEERGLFEVKGKAQQDTAVQGRPRAIGK